MDIGDNYVVGGEHVWRINYYGNCSDCMSYRSCEQVTFSGRWVQRPANGCSKFAPRLDVAVKEAIGG